MITDDGITHAAIRYGPPQPKAEPPLSPDPERKMRAEIRVDGEHSMRASWQQDNLEWMMSTTEDVASLLADFGKNKRGTFDAVVILRPHQP